MPYALESPVILVTTHQGASAVTVEEHQGAELEASGATATGSPLTLTLGTVPAGKSWRLRSVMVICRANTEFSAQVQGAEFASGKTNPSAPNVEVPLEAWLPAAAGEVVTVVVTQDSGPATPVEARIQYSEHLA